MDIKSLLTRLDDISEAKDTKPKFVGYLGAKDPASKVKSRLVGAMEQVEKEISDRINEHRPDIVTEDPVQEDILDRVRRSFQEYLETVEQEQPDFNTLEPAQDRELLDPALDLELHGINNPEELIPNPSDDYLDER